MLWSFQEKRSSCLLLRRDRGSASRTGQGVCGRCWHKGRSPTARPREKAQGDFEGLTAARQAHSSAMSRLFRREGQGASAENSRHQIIGHGLRPAGIVRGVGIDFAASCAPVLDDDQCCFGTEGTWRQQIFDLQELEIGRIPPGFTPGIPHIIELVIIHQHRSQTRGFPGHPSADQMDRLRDLSRVSEPYCLA